MVGEHWRHKEGDIIFLRDLKGKFLWGVRDHLEMGGESQLDAFDSSNECVGYLSLGAALSQGLLMI